MCGCSLDCVVVPLFVSVFVVVLCSFVLCVVACVSPRVRCLLVYVVVCVFV